jgi:hypothetical protein
MGRQTCLVLVQTLGYHLSFLKGDIDIANLPIKVSLTTTSGIQEESTP